MLIPAHEARKILRDSAANIERLLKYISTQIQKRAEAGFNFLVLEELPNENMSDIFKLTFSKPSSKYEVLVDKIKSELFAAGYRVGLARKEITVGGGLGSDGDPVTKSIEQLIVQW
jgi:hypothetical protein